MKSYLAYFIFFEFLFNHTIFSGYFEFILYAYVHSNQDLSFPPILAHMFSETEIHVAWELQGFH